MDEAYKKLYSLEGVHGNINYGSPLVARGLKCAVYYTQFFPKKKVLCLGAGNGYEAVFFDKKGWDVTVFDLYIPDVDYLKGKMVQGDANNMPFKDDEFELVFSCEMLEHVPEDETDQILLEVKRISKKVFFTIATVPDPPHNSHINLHDICWWLNRFSNLGFTITHTEFPLKVANKFSENKTVSYSWPDGILINAKC